MPSQDDNPKGARRQDSNESLDFGAFVESNVQRTSDLLKGESDPSATPADRPGGSRTVERARDGGYWRKRAAGAGVDSDLPGDDLPPPQAQQRARRNRYLPSADDGGDQFHDANEFDGGGGGFSDTVNKYLNGDDGGRNRIIAIAIALLLLLAIIWGLINLLGGDENGGSGDVTPTPTEQVLTPSTPNTQPTGTETAEPGETPEPEIPRGGDNQRGEGTDADGTEEAQIEITNDVARACTGHCLVRMDGPNQAEVLEEAGTRASWSEGDISWVVVSPEQAQKLSESATLTFIESDPRTYNLYVVKATEDHNDPAVISPNGEIIDQTGRYYLVRWNGAPAIVKPVTDWGYGVFKIAPAPPETIAQLGVNGPARETTGWALMEEIDQGNVERVTNELVHIGELDESGWGTRYYTYPGNQIAADYLFQELESYGLKVWYEDFITWDGYLLVNVVGEIPGADDSETYAMMAHLDTINLDNSRIAPGADDNASGIASTLEVARILAGYDLEHPVRVAFVNAEEVGILGSPAWARQANKDNVNIAGVFNIDSVGSVRNRPLIMTNAGPESAWMQDLLTQVNSDFDLGESLQHYQSDSIVADDNFVRDEGIPAVMIARELYQQSDYHHTANDTPEHFSIGAIVDTSKIILVAMWTLVQ